MPLNNLAGLSIEGPPSSPPGTARSGVDDDGRPALGKQPSFDVTATDTFTAEDLKIGGVESVESLSGVSFFDLERIKVLGKGASGKVLLVRHKRGDEHYALKEMAAVADRDARLMAVNEIRIAKRHAKACDQLVATLDAFYVDGKIHILLEYMDGGSLVDVFASANRGLPGLPALPLGPIAIQMLSGLRYMHREMKQVCARLLQCRRPLCTQSCSVGLLATHKRPLLCRPRSAVHLFPLSQLSVSFCVCCVCVYFSLDCLLLVAAQVHRDLKPANVLLSGSGAVKLSDFGVAKQLSSSDGFAMTQVGSTAYMSPERMKGEEYTYTSDVWSVGVIMLEALLGEHPFPPSRHKNFVALFNAISRGDCPPPPEGTPAELSSFVALCLRLKQSERASVDDLLASPWLEPSGKIDVRQKVQQWLLMAATSAMKAEAGKQQAERDEIAAMKAQAKAMAAKAIARSAMPADEAPATSKAATNSSESARP